MPGIHSAKKTSYERPNIVKISFLNVFSMPYMLKYNLRNMFKVCLSYKTDAIYFVLINFACKAYHSTEKITKKMEICPF